MSPTPQLSVILPAFNPARGRLACTLGGLAAQTIEPSRWEVLLIDNASDPAAAPGTELAATLPGFRLLQEPERGLTPARLCGIRAARGEVLVFVDDDNVLAPDYLAEAGRLFQQRPQLGAAGGTVLPEWETPPPAWTMEFHGLLALRPSALAPLVAQGGPGAPWPAFAPVGAGLCVRRTAIESYVQALAHDPVRLNLDRSGSSLASGGDNDLVFEILNAGWDIGYFPSLTLTHLIPASRLEPTYLARLNEGIMRTWVRVLHLHGQCPWPAIAPWTVPLRALRAWWRYQAWRSPAHRIRWRGAVGQFRGQADIGKFSRQSVSPCHPS
jgi:glycosyltransferase involved in cell wall biosynthesis